MDDVNSVIRSIELKYARKSIWKRHSLSLVACAILGSWFVLYIVSDPDSHFGSFFGNAVADWMGVLISIIFTKWFFEKGSKESREPDIQYSSKVRELVHEHSLTIALIVTGLGWIIVYSRLDPVSKWGTVVSNFESEWSQQIGLIILTKRLIEVGSAESHGENK